MQNASFLYNNLFDSADALTVSCQHNNFPATRTQHRWHTRTWRSNYGAGSGWGTFVITAASNDRIDFEETIGVPLVATLVAATYDADTLATEIKTRLDAAGASTYTVTYSDSTNMFTLTSNGAGGGGVFRLLWNSGANKARSVAGSIGFDDSADDTGALTYTSDYLRIHTEEWLKVDLGSAQDILAFAFKNHNFSSTATVRIQGNNADAWGAPAVDVTLSLTDDITIYIWSAAQSYQWWRIYIQDVDNSDGYVEIGRVFLGSYYSPSVNCRRDYAIDLEDPSDVLSSDGGQISSNLKEKYEVAGYVFEYISDTDIASFRTMWNAMGKTGNFFFVRDRDDASNTVVYARFAVNIRYEHIQREELYRARIVIEELR